MKKVSSIFVPVFIFLLFASVAVVGAETGRIGVIDFQKILMESEAGKAIQSEIQQKGRLMEAELRKMGEEIETMIEQLQRDSMVMSAQRREQQHRDLEIKRYDFQTMQKKYQSEFREMEVGLVEKLRDEVFDITEAIGKQEGYMLIIERSAAIYFPSTIDITDRVIQSFNKTIDG